MSGPVEAGEGEHRVYRIVPQSTDRAKLTVRNHYVGVDAVAWYINKEGSWFTDRMASGTLDIQLSGGMEKYQAGLGTFELKGGAKVAPVFDKAVIPDRNYRGGPLVFAASLTAIKKNTAIAGMLKSAASASLGIAAGMVQTASLTGPAALLAGAGQDLIAGVKKVLSDTAEKREPLFDFSGLEKTIQPEEITGPEVYLLFHRGTILDEAKLTVHASGQVRLPYHAGAALEDGAWLLLRVRRSDEYSGARDWFDSGRNLRGKIESLVSDVDAGFVAKESALRQLMPGPDGNAPIYEEFARLRTIIQNDGVLTEREASLHVADLKSRLTLARDAINASDKKLYDEGLINLKTSLVSGKEIGGRLGEAFKAEVAELLEMRSATLIKDTSFRRIADLSGTGSFEAMRYMPTVLNRIMEV